MVDSDYFKYKMWADKRALAASKKIDRRHYSDDFAFVCQQFNHMVIVEELFRSRLEGTPAPHCATNTVDVPCLDELASRLVCSSNWYLRFIELEADFQKTISFTFADGKQGTMTVQEILFHIVNHGSYHRGNIARTLDQAGVPHPIDGYGAFIHESEPARRNQSTT